MAGAAVVFLSLVGWVPAAAAPGRKNDPAYNINEEDERGKLNQREINESYIEKNKRRLVYQLVSGICNVFYIILVCGRMTYYCWVGGLGFFIFKLLQVEFIPMPACCN